MKVYFGASISLDRSMLPIYQEMRIEMAKLMVLIMSFGLIITTKLFWDQQAAILIIATKLMVLIMSFGLITTESNYKYCCSVSVHEIEYKNIGNQPFGIIDTIFLRKCMQDFKFCKIQLVCVYV